MDRTGIMAEARIMDMAIDRPTMAAGVAMLRHTMAGGAPVTMADIAGVVAVIMVVAAIMEAARFMAVVDAIDLS